MGTNFSCDKSRLRSSCAHRTLQSRTSLPSWYFSRARFAPTLTAEMAAILHTVKKEHAEDLIGAVKSIKQNQKLTAALMLAAIREEKNAFIEAALSVSAERSI